MSTPPKLKTIISPTATYHTAKLVDEFPAGYQKIPGTDYILDELSRYIFTHVAHEVFQLIKKDKITYTLCPLTERNHNLYKQDALDLDSLDWGYKGLAHKEGSYGYIELHLTSRVAVKISKNSFPYKDLSTDFIREIGVYRLLEKTGYSSKIYHLKPGYIYMEKGTTLSTIIPQLFDPVVRTELMFQALQCMQTADTQGLIHCDLKPSNIIVSADDMLQVIDWGTVEIDQTRDQTKAKPSRIQTLWWRAPEILQARPLKMYNTKIDVFSLGLIFAELYANYYGITSCMSGDGDEKQLSNARYVFLRHLLNWEKSSIQSRDCINRVFTSLVVGDSLHSRLKNVLMSSDRFVSVAMDSPENGRLMPEPLADMIAHMLEFNPKHRWSWSQLIAHPYFATCTPSDTPKCFVNEISITRPPQTHLRRSLLEWMASPSGYSYLDSLDAICLSWQLFDLYVSSTNITDGKSLMCVSASCTLIASKIYDHHKLHPSELTYWDDQQLTDGEIILQERKIILALDGNVIIPSLYTFYSHAHGELKPTDDICQKFFDLYTRPDIYSQPFSQTWQDLTKDIRPSG